MPRAVFASIAIMAVSYVLFAYATVTGFGDNVTKLGQSAIPFITVANSTLGAFAFFAYLAGFTSTLGALIAGVNSQARLVFNAGREGLLPRWIGKVDTTRRTPVRSIFAFVSIALAIIGVWALLHAVHGGTGALNPITFFDESSTMGTVLVLVVYLLSNLALPFYYRKFRPAEFHWVKHGVLPALGAVAIIVPLYYLAKPGQPTPYDWFPYAALIVVVVVTVYAFVLNRSDSGLADRVGSLVADE